MKNGKFITFEGLDGGGKSTQAKHLAQWLRDNHGISVVETREPGGTTLGEKLREIIFSGDKYDPITETLLMLTARREHICKVIKPALAKGEWVVCDRFTDSTIAYQGGGRGVSIETIKELSRLTVDGLHPDLTFYIKTPNSDNASIPLFSRLAEETTFETATADFYRRAANTYETIIKTEKRVINTAAMAGNRRLTEEEVAKSIQKKIKPLL